MNRQTDTQTDWVYRETPCWLAALGVGLSLCLETLLWGRWICALPGQPCVPRPPEWSPQQGQPIWAVGTEAPGVGEGREEPSLWASISPPHCSTLLLLSRRKLAFVCFVLIT